MAEQGQVQQQIPFGNDNKAKARVVPVRGTQSFVHTLSACWRRPGLTALEVAWRWGFGIPALGLLWWQLRAVLLGAMGGVFDPARLGLDSALLKDPVGALTADTIGAIGKFGAAFSLVEPGLVHAGRWVAPVLLGAWVVASSVGRRAVLHRAGAGSSAGLGTMMGIGAIRAAALALVLTLWFRVLEWCGVYTVTGPLDHNQEPNLVLYCGLAIVISLGMFTAWAVLSWVLAVAPLIAALRGTGIGTSLRGALRLGAVRSKLMEINLVMGIVRIALVVLAMVFSACPLPFETIETQEFLLGWWAVVTVIYLVWSDFFHIAQIVAYLNLLRAYDVEA